MSDREAATWPQPGSNAWAHAEVKRVTSALADSYEQGEALRKANVILMAELAAARPKVEAYDAARATVKIEGNTRAYYVLRAEVAETREAKLREIAVRFVAKYPGNQAAVLGNGAARRALDEFRAALADGEGET